LRQDRASTREDGSINLVMGGSCQYGESEQHFGLEEMLTPVIRLVLLPLTADRVEARLSWRLDCDGLRAHLVNVLDAIAARWPELRRTIQGPIAPTHKSITYSPRPTLSRPYPWKNSFGGPIEPTPQVLANWKRLQQESLGRAPLAAPPAGTRTIEKAKSAKYGTYRVLSYDDVKEIVTRGKAWQSRGGKMPEFYKSLGLRETDDGYFTLATLRKWLRDPCFE
jgi:hypothetical protein